MVDARTLILELRHLTRRLEEDLHQQATQATTSADRLRVDYQRGIDTGRTSAGWATWLEDRVTQTAMAWVLATVFIRFIEDNRLFPGPPLLNGQTSEAEEHPATGSTPSGDSFSYRDWLLSVFDAVAALPGGSWFLDTEHNPLYQLSISENAARELIEFWRRRNDAGQMIWNLSRSTLDTSFLTDLYQDLSESARKSYALLATPPFVVDVILDLTLEPAIEEFGYDRVRIVDPVCGSGQFIIAGFHRLLREWHKHAPHQPVTEHVRLALDAVHAVDLTPLAAAITRFRLLIAALRAAGLTSFAEIRDLDWKFHVAVGDALLREARGPELFSTTFSYATEDLAEHADMLTPSNYQVVVGNPPYTAVRDSQLQKRYRELYDACQGMYPLTVPFTQRFFELAARANQHGRGAGYVGLLLANSFMKREFGRALAEDFLAERVTLTSVIDTSGAFLPGHGAPTAIVVGRNAPPADDTQVFAVVGLRGEPEVPTVPEQGRVWQSILTQIRQPSLASAWTQSLLLDRASLRSHPWNLAGSAVTGTLRKMTRQRQLKDLVARIGYQANTGSDDLFTAPAHSFRRLRTEDSGTRVAVITGSEVRDWLAVPSKEAFYPGTRERMIEIERYPGHHRRLWPYRTTLGGRPNYTTRSYFADGRRWYEWHQVAADDDAHPWSITFSWVATHTHFALLREGVMALHSAPVIKLAAEADERHHIELVALLNSSAVCFWLKQHSHSKGRPTADQTGTGEPWTMVYEFTATRLGQLPLPEDLPTKHAFDLDRLAQELAAATPAAALADGHPIRERLVSAHTRREGLRGRIVALQEELDWDVYRLYGLLPEDVDVDRSETVPPIHPGERAFEIVLARQVQAGDLVTTWFERNGATPVTEPPEDWPADYRKVVEQRIDLIESDLVVSTLEQPEFKRRWSDEGWDRMLDTALREWLLDRCESTDLWFDQRDGDARATPLTTNRLADRIRRDDLALEIADIYRPNATLAEVLAEVIEGEHVPFLAALRYRESGLAKRATWENVWQFQRQEDEEGKREEAGTTATGGRSAVPPRYSSADFTKISYWRHRGKYDVPNERFTSYPGTDERGLLIGWAGWDPTLRAQVLADLIAKKLTGTDGEAQDGLIPLLAGLRETLPWLAPDNDARALLEEYMRRLTLTEDDLTNWRPPKSKRGRPRKAT